VGSRLARNVTPAKKEILAINQWHGSHFDGVTVECVFTLSFSCGERSLHETVAFQRAPARRVITTLSDAADRIRWVVDPEALRRGDISALPLDLIKLIIEAAELPAVRAIAGLTRNAIAIVVGLIAASIASTNRSAERIARAILRGIDDVAIAEAQLALGLSI
jgi:hypothetical protein